MKVVIIGCTHAGTMAAIRILQDHPETELVIYERHQNVSFLSCGISLYLSGEVKRLEDMFYSSPQDLKNLGAVVKTQHEVLRINAKDHRIQVADMTTGKLFEDTYDKLIMSTGSSVALPPIYGIDESKVLLCKDYQQAQAIYDSAKSNKRIAIVGAGYAGTELAESYARTDHEVTLFQRGKQVLNNYVGKELSDQLVKLLADHGIGIHLNHRVTAFRMNKKDELEIETNQGNFTADLAIVATGFVPNTQLLAGQVQLEKHGAFIVNDYLQTSDPDIYAAGDCAMVRFNPTGKPAYTPLATNAIRQGTLIALNIFNQQYPYMGTQATSAMKLFGYCVATTGLTLENAQRHHIAAEQVIYQGTWRPTYMPSTDPLTIALVYNPENRQVLGAQLCSKHDVSQSANAVSVLIQNNNTIDDMAFIDMLFQPNFDLPFNYLNLVAQKAVDKEWQKGNVTPRHATLGNHL
ncbi:FAD-dependent oxidoreductase [Lentilactobacillus kisonensis]|uniref:NADH oxidase n=1 Tax=Lentilactobacillus kisonensis DSM 19906 = JCM 15041 TaxID=1423766 RepID=A0A0R1NJ89_9LACO|nr:FAD-dependent oxidoreductase [Lentilactobacillus kisonensis]KRL20590.1 NADH oxidase [Lentilactobacillus kisonensis DSM 19906 = JCM 15041]